jgi:transposase-like protein
VTDAVDADRHPRDDPDRLRKLYHEEGLSLAEIAERFGVVPKTVHRWMIRHDIDTRGAVATADSHVNGPPYEFAYRDPDYLRAAYWVRGQTLSEIAGAFGVSYVTVAHWMRKHSIPRRNRKDS